MKILVNAIPMTGLLTGIARYLRNLYQTVNRLGLSDTAYFTGSHLYSAMPPMKDAKNWQAVSRTLRRLPASLVFGLRAARWHMYEHQLNRLFNGGRSDFTLYHETSFTPAKLTAIPTVYSVYDMSLRRFKDTHPKERVWLFEYFMKTRLRYARHILTISEFIRQEIMDEFKVPPSMVSNVPLAPDPLFFARLPGTVAQVRSKYGLPGEYLLFVSSLEPRKNIGLLMEAMAAAKTDIPLVLVGWHGWGDKAWQKLVNTGNLKGRIFFTGHVPDQDLAAVYTGATAMVYPSLYEGFGLPILEAMACGCPVICSNAAGMTETAGPAGWLIDPGDRDSLVHAIEILVHDSGQQRDLRSAGLAWAARFTWDRTARKTVDIFRRVS
jgi:alpha-1,3-rhamnosyl/mannosyltransferase